MNNAVNARIKIELLVMIAVTKFPPFRNSPTAKHPSLTYAAFMAPI
jgi:hypothetical protein